MTVYGGNGCYGDYGWRAGRGVTVIYNPSGQEIGYVDPTTVNSVGAYIWNLDPHSPGTGVCKLPCTPVWICEPGQTGWEIDGCGNRRANPACNPPQIGSISFTSTPSGAEIFLDGIDQGVNTPNTISNVPVGTHTYVLRLAGYYVYTGSVSVTLNQTIAVSATLTPAYTEAMLVSCNFPVNAIAGQTYQGTITVNQGTLIENYKLVFSGDLAGESIPFTVNAGTGQQQITVGGMVFPTGGPKTVTATLVKI